MPNLYNTPAGTDQEPKRVGSDATSANPSDAPNQKPISKLHQAARDLAAKGVRIFPILPGTKFPAFEGGFQMPPPTSPRSTHGTARRTTTSAGQRDDRWP